MTTELDAHKNENENENGTANSAGQSKKTRGRPPGKVTQNGKKEKLSARQVTGILYLASNTAADAVGVPEIGMNEDEAGQIASALVDVLQFYDFEASAKTVAWCNLAGSIAAVYGLKIHKIMTAKRDA